MRHVHGCAGLQLLAGISACTQTSTVVVLGSTAGLTTVTLPAMSPSGPVMVAGLPDFDRRRFLHRNVGARDHLRNIHDRQERRSAGRHLARVNGPVGHDAGDRAADLRIRELRGGAFEMGFGGVPPAPARRVICSR